MSENKDLEIIKSEVDFLDKYMADHELDERLNAILVHAEHMAAEIERLEEEKILLIKFIDEIASHGQRRESKEGEMSDFTKCKNCYFLEPEEFILNAFYCDWDGHTTNLEDQCSNNKFVNNNKEKQEARDE